MVLKFIKNGFVKAFLKDDASEPEGFKYREELEDDIEIPEGVKSLEELDEEESQKNKQEKE